MGNEQVRQSVAAFVAACNRRLHRAARRLKRLRNENNDKVDDGTEFGRPQLDRSPSCLTPGRVLMGSFRKTAGLLPLLVGKRPAATEATGWSAAEEEANKALWSRTILMGEKCEPLDYAGVIYYDSKGNKLDEAPPRTPRHMMIGASPLPGFLLAAAAVAAAPEKGRN